MKKKFVLVLALVCLVAMSAFAADKTPVTLSGKAKLGYKFSFQEGSDTSIAAAKTLPLYVDSLSVAGDFWKVGISGTPTFNGDWGTSGYAEVYFDKLAKAAGKDWGKFTLTVGSGSNKNTMGAPYVYADPNGTLDDNGYARLRMGGKYSVYATIGYDMVSLYLSASPLLWVKHTVDADHKEYYDGDTGEARNAFMASVKVTPIDGLALTVGYTGFASRKYTADNGKTTEFFNKKGGFGGDVIVDLKKLAKMDFDLKVSAAATIYPDDPDNPVFNKTGFDMLASVYGGNDVFNVYAEFQMWNLGIAGMKTIDTMLAKVSYTGIKNVSIYAKYTLADLTKVIATNMAHQIGLGASYKYAPITFGLDLTLDMMKDVKALFAVTPYCQIVF